MASVAAGADELDGPDELVELVEFEEAALTVPLNFDAVGPPYGQLYIHPLWDVNLDLTFNGTIIALALAQIEVLVVTLL